MIVSRCCLCCVLFQNNKNKNNNNFYFHSKQSIGNSSNHLDFSSMKSNLFIYFIFAEVSFNPDHIDNLTIFPDNKKWKKKPEQLNKLSLNVGRKILFKIYKFLTVKILFTLLTTTKTFYKKKIFFVS